MKRVWQFFVTNQTGDTQSNAQITVTENGSAATIYSDKTGTPKSNVFFAESNGLARFYGDAGKYYTISIQVGTETLTLPDVYLGFPEPDSDNKTYAVKNGAWVEIVTELNVTKESLGLGNVDNTADIDKPISTAQQQALNLKQGIISGAATTITNDNLAASKVLTSNSLGKVAVGDCDADKLTYLKTARSDLQAQIDAVALGTDVLFLGFFTTQSALEAAHPSPDAGSWAYIDAASSDIKRATWDATDSKYVVGGSIANSDDITEGTTNLFYTAARQQAITDALALKVDKITGKDLSTNDYTDDEKLINYDTDSIFPTNGLDFVKENFTLGNNTFGVLKNTLLLPTSPSDITGESFKLIAKFDMGTESYSLYVNSGFTMSHLIKTSSTSFSDSKSNYTADLTSIQSDWSNKLNTVWDSPSTVTSFITPSSFFTSTTKNKRVVGVKLSSDPNQALELDSEKALLLDKSQFVEAVSGKGLSTNDYDNTAKNIVDNISANYVANISGKGLSTNDYDDAAKNKVDSLSTTYQPILIEKTYSEIQALTPTNGLEFYDTTWKVKVRGNGTHWIPQSSFRVYAETTNDSSSSTSLVTLRAIPVPFKYLGDKGMLTMRHNFSFSGTSTNANWAQIRINNSAGSGGTLVWLRSSASNLNIVATREINSSSRTKHTACATGQIAPEATAVESVYTYDTTDMTHIIYECACSGLTSDTITLRSVYIDIFPSFS